MEAESGGEGCTNEQSCVGERLKTIQKEKRSAGISKAGKLAPWRGRRGWWGGRRTGHWLAAVDAHESGSARQSRLVVVSSHANPKDAAPL